jgi:hypothetical protein
MLPVLAPENFTDFYVKYYYWSLPPYISIPSVFKLLSSLIF